MAKRYSDYIFEICRNLFLMGPSVFLRGSLISSPKMTSLISTFQITKLKEISEISSFDCDMLALLPVKIKNFIT